MNTTSIITSKEFNEFICNYIIKLEPIFKFLMCKYTSVKTFFVMTQDFGFYLGFVSLDFSNIEQFYLVFCFSRQHTERSQFLWLDRIVSQSESVFAPRLGEQLDQDCF